MSNEQSSAANNRVLPFIEPFDTKRGEIDEEEQRAVRTKFKNLFSNAQLNHASGTLESVSSTTSLKRRDDSDPNVEWGLLMQEVPAGQADLEQQQEGSDRHTISHVVIQKKIVTPGDWIGTPREMFVYTLGLDGVVRRKDRGDITAALEQQRASGHAITAVTQEQELLNLSGQNDQPISLVEMAGLEDFAQQPGWQTPPALALGIKALGARFR